MLLEKLVRPFLEQRPYCVVVRAALQRMLSPSRLDQIFRTHAVEQYERDLLFSSLVDDPASDPACRGADGQLDQ